MSWHPFESGSTLGTSGSESGLILRDDEHERGARITLERDTVNAPFAITCGIYGSMFHTAFASAEQEANQKYDEMKLWLDRMLGDDVNEADYLNQLQEFVNRF
ncbi:MAG: hypothetical protein FJ304_03120 [Planctomycetes bacterium]|nr:hypothetical protein [Planctomycetota bacterium]